MHNTTDNNFDRAYYYDHAGRLTTAAAGGAARHDSGAVPMNEIFQYNAWHDTTIRSTESWLNAYYDSASYTDDGRRTGWGYDADGRIASIDTRSYSYDAGGQNISFAGQRWAIDAYVPTTTGSGFDGDGNRIRETSDSSGTLTTTYYLRSSVLGGAIVEELNSGGQKTLGYVYTPAGGLLARQVATLDYVSLKQISPMGASQYEFSFGSTLPESISRQEFDPVGAQVRLTSGGQTGHGGAPGDIPGGGSGPSDSRFGAIENPGAGCTLDGVWIPCSWADRLLNQGAARACPGGDCSPRRVDIDIRFNGGTTLHYAGLVDAFLFPEGYDHTFPGEAARAAAGVFNLGTDWFRNFTEVVLNAVLAGIKSEEEDKPLKNHSVAQQNPTKEEHGETVYVAQQDPRGGSYLSPCAKYIFGKIGFGKFVDLADVRVHIGIPDWIAEGAEHLGGVIAGAVTIGNDIYYRSVSDYNPSTVEGLAELGHELTHIQQYNALGYDVFVTKYIGEYIKNGFRYGLGMDLENKASHVEDLLKQSIPQRFGNDPCKDFRH